ncbi:MAG: YjbE family putative metal transport protein [Negativicutes bacterium]|nr:YjbE family putative metal transport protein [Negativicutes bacterium]
MEWLPGLQWLMAFGSILVLNLLLSGDNALVIAMASRTLPAGQRRRAAAVGTAGAVLLRVLLTLVAAVLLDVPYLQFCGGLLLLWIAVKLLCEKDGQSSGGQAGSMAEAIRIILLADLVMSLDNVLALAAVAQTLPDSKYSLITAGLATSIPLVIFGAQVLTKLMERYPVIIYAGAGILGYAAAEMIVSDKAVGGMIGDYEPVLKIGLTVMVFAIGCWRKRTGTRKGD